MDPTTLANAWYGMLFGGMVYASKSALAGRADRLDAESIIRGAFGLGNMTSPIPMIVDPLAGILGIDSMRFSGYTRPGVAGPRILSSIPVMDTMERVLHIPEATVSVMSGDYEKSDVSAMQALPIIGNHYVSTVVFNEMKKDVTRRKQRERRAKKKAKALATQQETKKINELPTGTKTESKSLNQAIDKAEQIISGGD